MEDQDTKTSEGEGLLKTLEVEIDPENHDLELGMNLTRSGWDPYPWVAYVLEDGPADKAGVRAGDVLLSIDNTDLIGLKISNIATILKSLRGPKIVLALWTNAKHSDCDPESLCCGPLPSGLTATKAALSAILAALECPVCGGTWGCGASGKSGVQCSRGHLLCGQCRRSISSCPMCRAPFYDSKDPRCKNIFAETVYNSIVEAFRLESTSDCQERHTCLNRRIFGNSPRRPKVPIVRIDGVSSCHDIPSTMSASCDNIAVANRCSICVGQKPLKRKPHNKLLERLLMVSNSMPWRAMSVGDLTSSSVEEQDSKMRSVSASHVNRGDGEHICECGRVIDGTHHSSTNGVAGSNVSLSISESALEARPAQGRPSI